MRTYKRNLSLILTVALLLGLCAGFAPAARAAGNVFTTISAGGACTMAIKTDGTLWTWGGNEYGGLGDGTTTARDFPVKIMDDVMSVSTVGSHAVAIKTDGTLWAWGWNENGQIGDGTTINRLSPVKVLDDVKAVSLNWRYTIAIKTDGSLWAWGFNQNGFGDGTVEERHLPVKIMDDVASVSTSWSHTMAVKTDGSLWGWGSNEYGEINETFTGLLPVKVMDNVSAVAAGNHYTLVISLGSLYAWGRNELGQLGDGSTNDTNALIKIMDNVTAVSADWGGVNSAAVKTDGTLWVWGWNRYGQIGDGSGGNYTEEDNKTSPVKVLDNVNVVSLGCYNSAALKNDGTLWMWGMNYIGAFGNSMLGDSNIPIKIMGGILLPGCKPNALPGLSSWAVDEANSLNTRNVIPTSLKSNFQTPIHRDEFTALLVNIYEYAKNPITANFAPFADIADSPYKNDIEKAYNLGLIDGTSPTKFTPDGLLTREQTAKLLYTMVDIIDGATLDNTAAPDFTDNAAISGWAIPYVAYAQKHNLMLGTATGKFDPQGNLTREQAMVVAERLIMQYGW